jgi:hypothetical protein
VSRRSSRWPSGAGAGALGFLQGGRRELDRDVVGCDRDQAHGARVAHRPDALDHAGAAGERAAAGSTQTMSPGRAPFLSAGRMSKLDFQLAVGRE